MPSRERRIGAQGFLELEKRAPHAAGAPVSGDRRSQQLIASYRQALAAGARLVVGPLTRNAVNALAAAPHLITVPTLVLNVPERPGANNTNANRLYVLSLQVEAEARQAAQLALSEGRRKAFTVSDASQFARRSASVRAASSRRRKSIAETLATDSASLDRCEVLFAASRMVFYAVTAAASAVLGQCPFPPRHRQVNRGECRGPATPSRRALVKCRVVQPFTRRS